MNWQQSWQQSLSNLMADNLLKNQFGHINLAVFEPHYLRPILASYSMALGKTLEILEMTK